MITFLQFVESKDEFEEEEQGLFGHRAKIGKNEIRVSYSLINPNEKTSTQWKVDFAINKSYDDKHLLDHEVPKALHFVHHSIKKFVKEKQPTHLHFNGNTPQKTDAYHAYAKTLAKKLGWNHYSWNHYSDGTYHTISKEKPNVPHKKD
jgi:hypothetical protein